MKQSILDASRLRSSSGCRCAFPSACMGRSKFHEKPRSFFERSSNLKTFLGLCDLVLEGSVRDDVEYLCAVEQGCPHKKLVVAEGPRVNPEGGVYLLWPFKRSRLSERRCRSKSHKSRARRLLDRHSSARVVQRRLLSGTAFWHSEETGAG